MKKKYSSNNEEIDIVDVIRTWKILWSNKIQIILITLFSLLIGFGYSYTNSIQNKNLFTIEVSKELNFLEILYLRELLVKKDDNKKNITNINIQFYNDFIIELMDFDELASVTKNYANLKNKPLVFSKVRENRDNYYSILGFAWHDYQESRDIIEQTIKLTAENLKKRIVDKFNYLLKIKKYITTQKDLDRLNYLSEQILIAKKLEINSNSLNTLVDTNDQNLVIKGIDYLKGSDALEEEVKIIKNRNYGEFDRNQKQINLLMEKDFNFIDYKISPVEKYSLKNNFKILFISILLGFIIGILYVVVFDKYSSKKAF